MAGTRAVTEKAGTLQAAGLLTYRRARIPIVGQAGFKRQRAIGHPIA